MDKAQKILLISFGIVIVLFLFLSANKGVILEQVLPDDIPAEVVEKIIDLPSDVSLGELCSGKTDCLLFCKDNGDACVSFCMENPDNEMCSAFTPEDFEEAPLE
tara:strand:+ start:494 stop:805 length:312 start_codon:yes stop_codon:yes gene_type:complete